MIRAAWMFFSGFVSLLVGTHIAFSGLYGQEPKGNEESLRNLKTIAESSDYQATSVESEVESFVKALDQASPRARLESIGYTVEGRALHALVVGEKGKLDLPLAAGDERLVVVLLGNIHSGECDGKEALLALARDILSNTIPGWDSKLLLVFVPNYNADGNQRVGLLHRAGQDGPQRGMGVRENAQNLDLNRDFVKLESPEARALIRAIDTFHADVLIDMHTTNGSLHRYPLTYDIPHNPAAPVELVSWLRKSFLPMATQDMTKKGIDTFYYGNFDADHRKWETYGHEPRYSTEYMGLRGRIGILSESYSYATYQQRVEASYQFVDTCLNLLAEHRTEVHRLLKQADDRLMGKGPRPKVPLNAELMVDPEPVNVLGYAFPPTSTESANPSEAKSDAPSAARKFPSPADKGRRDELIPTTYHLQLWNQFRPANEVDPPAAYFLPSKLAWCAERLAMHGIQVEPCDEKELPEGSVSAYPISELGSTQFQGLTLRKISVGAARKSSSRLGSGFLVRTSQPLGVMATYLLEPASDESLASWGFLDGYLEKGRDYPVYRVAELANAIVPRKLLERDSFKSEPLTISNIFEPGKSIAWSGSVPAPVRWLKGSSEYLMERGGGWFAVDAATGSMRPFDRLRRLSNSLAKLEAFSDEAKRREVVKIEAFNDDYTLALIPFSNDLYLYDSNTEITRQLTHSPDQEKSLAELNRPGNRVAYVHKNNLYVVDTQSTEVRQCTQDGDDETLNGKLDWVYQEEIYGRGNFKAFWWSPDGTKIAFLKLVEQKVPRYQVSDSISFPQTLEETRYPKAGAPNPEARLMVQDVVSKKTVEILLEDYPIHDRLICRVDWHPERPQVVVQVQNRIQSQLDLFLGDADSGKAFSLFREKSKAWIDIVAQPRWLPSASAAGQDLASGNAGRGDFASPDAGSFLWVSDLPDGRRHLYLVSSDGKKRTPLTSGDWDIEEFIAVSKDGTSAWVTGNVSDATSQQLVKVDIPNRKWELVTKEAGLHKVAMHESCDFYCDVFSSPVRPPRIEIRDSSSKLLRVVNATTLDRYRTLNIVPPKLFTISARDGMPLQSMLIAPPGVDINSTGLLNGDSSNSKKIPVLIHVYAGPSNPTVRNQWQAGNYWWHQYLAVQGIAVLLCDNRSSRGQGNADTWKVYKDLGRVELQDLEDAAAWVKNQPWADSDRIGVWGWSYGGYFTAYAMTHSKLFRAGISGAPVTDWRNYDSVYTERYMGLPAENEAGYRTSSVVEAASELHGRLLLIHGEMDDNVHMSNTLQFANALQKAQKPFDLMIYPKNRHGVVEPSQRLHMYQMMTDFLMEHLKGE